MNDVIASGKKFKEDGDFVNIADRTDEAFAQSGHHVVPLATEKTPSVGKVFIAIYFPNGGSFTAITDASLLSGDATTTIYESGSFYYGRVSSYTADAITDAIEGV